MEIKDKKIKEIEKELEDKIYHNGQYRKMCGSNDITVTYNESLSEDYIEEYDGTENLVLSFKVEHTQDDENGGKKEWWNIDVELDKEFNITEIRND